MIQTPYPARVEVPQSLPGADIASFPIIHQDAVDATYVACDPLHKDVVLAAYAAVGWQVENVTEDDYRNVMARRARELLLEAWTAAEKSGDTQLTAKVRPLALFGGAD